MYRSLSVVLASVVVGSVALSACTPFESRTGDGDAGTSVVEPPTEAGPGACGPQNCGGCCLGGICQAGTSITACGAGGGLCATCRSGQICTDAQICAVDPESVWLVQPVSATILSTKDGSASWDIGLASATPPDAYVTLACPGGTGRATKTEVADDTLAPKWTTGGCTRKAKELLGNPVQVSVADDDTALNIGRDDIIVPATPLQLVESDLLTGQRALPATARISELKFTLTRQ